MRKKIIVGNWKMNKTIAEALDFVKAVDQKVHDQAEFGIATSFVALKSVKDAAKNLIVAAQNVHFKDSGAYTGEVSAPMLKELGLTHVIIGHSERRQMFNCSDEDVNLQAKKLLENDIVPIICVGETLEQFEESKTKEVIDTQVSAALNGIDAKDVEKVVIAYEPIWAIGTGKSASAQIAQDSCKAVRDVVAKLFGQEVADKLRVQYGGSVNTANIEEYMSQADIDGALIGGASLKADSFTEIIEKVK